MTHQHVNNECSDDFCTADLLKSHFFTARPKRSCRCCCCSIITFHIFSPGRFALAVNLVMLFSADRCCYGPVATSVVGRSNQSDYHLTAREIRKRASCCCTTRPIVFQMVHFRKLNCQQPMKQFQVDLGYDMSEIKKLLQKMQ